MRTGSLASIWFCQTNKGRDRLTNLRHDIAMPPTYEVISIKRTDAPPDTEGANWYEYVIAADDASTIRGCRQGSLKAVTSAVETIVGQLNERHAKKSKKGK